MPKGKKVLIVGTGTIGEPLIYLATESRADLGISEVFFHKRTPLVEEKGKVKKMQEAGAGLIIDDDKREKFLELGLHPAESWEKIIKHIDIVIDCTPEGNKLKEKYYKKLAKPSGFIAQGSEEGFGKPYAWTINDRALSPEDRFIQVVSCNTHQLVCPLNALVFSRKGLNGLKYGKFFIARRGSDISEDKLNPGIEAEAAKEKYRQYGTHQAYDAARVFKTMYGEDAKIPIHSQIIKAPTQYMHCMLFDIELREPSNYREAHELLKANPLIVFTNIKSNNRVFARARDASKIRGRILNQTVFYEPSLDVSEDGLRIRGTCFTPQDGNALLSSMAATLWLLNPKTYKEKMKVFDKYLFDEI